MGQRFGHSHHRRHVPLNRICCFSEKARTFKSENPRRTEPHELDNHRTTDNLPTDCEILIIGAGYAGAATAYHLLDDNPTPPSIVLLEAREACSGATARNGTVPELSLSKCSHIYKW